LTGNWAAGSDYYITIASIRAASAGGLRLSDDSDTLGISVEDGGYVGAGIADPVVALHTYHASDNTIALFESGDADCKIGLKDSGSSAAQGNLIITRGDTLIFNCNGVEGLVLEQYRMLLNTTVNTKMGAGLTLDQGGFDDEILAFKSSDVAHGMTALAETDTYGVFQKGTAAGGAVQVFTYGADKYGFLVMARYTTSDTTKSTSGRAPIELASQKKSGTTTTVPGANDNVVAIRASSTTRWLCDEDGDTWQAGKLGVGVEASYELHVYHATTNFIAKFQSGDDKSAILIEDDDTLGYLLVQNGLMSMGGQSAQGAGNFNVNATSGMCGINDNADANMTIGLVINQGANDNEILAFKSSDVAHGYTTGAETDTYATFLKVYGDYGGLKIFGYADNHASASQALQLNAYGAQASATKSTAAVGLITMYATQHDGANALADVTANGNIVAIRARVSSAWSTCWILDEDGDTWQSGNIGIGVEASLTYGVGLHMRGANPVVKIESNESSGWAYVEMISSGNTWTMGSYGGTEWDLATGAFTTRIARVTTGGILTLNDTSNNVNMTQGITLNQGANDNEILAFKSSDVAHGFTSIAESDTYGVFRKADGATGGLMTYSFRTGNYSYWVRGVVSLETAIKTSAGLAPIIFEGVDTDGGTSIQGLPADSNIVAIRNYGVGTVWIADADGDTWQSGGITATTVALSSYLTISAAGSPYVQIVDTTNSVDVRTYALDNVGQIGTISDHGFNIVTHNTNCIVCDTAGAVTKPLQPSFSATLSGAQTNLDTASNVTIQFNTEIFDRNSDFNTSTYTFTAPITGIYQFNVKIHFSAVDSSAGELEVKLITSNRTYTLDYATGAELSSDDLLDRTFSILADMDAADTAYVAVYMSGGGATNDVSTLSWFSGYLVA
jgi:hypothetical protein